MAKARVTKAKAKRLTKAVRQLEAAQRAVCGLKPPSAKGRAALVKRLARIAGLPASVVSDSLTKAGHVKPVGLPAEIKHPLERAMIGLAGGKRRQSAAWPGERKRETLDEALARREASAAFEGYSSRRNPTSVRTTLGPDVKTSTEWGRVKRGQSWRASARAHAKEGGAAMVLKGDGSGVLFFRRASGQIGQRTWRQVRPLRNPRRRTVPQLLAAVSHPGKAGSATRREARRALELRGLTPRQVAAGIRRELAARERRIRGAARANPADFLITDNAGNLLAAVATKGIAATIVQILARLGL